MDGMQTKVEAPEGAVWFREMLQRVGESQASLARLMARNGDDRVLANIERSIRRMAAGDARVSGEMRVVLTMLLNAKVKRAKRAASAGGDAAQGDQQPQQG